MAELGEVRETLAVNWERHAATMVLAGATLLLVAALYALGYVPWPVFLTQLVLLKVMLVIDLGPAVCRRVEVAEHGLRVHGWSGVRELRWDELEAYYVAAYGRFLPLPGEPPVARLLRLQGSTGSASVVDDVERFDALLARVRAVIDDHDQGAQQAAFDRGESVAIGPLRVARDAGLAFAGRGWPWSEVRRIDCRGGMLRWTGSTPCPLGLLPNPHLLLGLLERQGVDVSSLRATLDGRAG